MNASPLAAQLQTLQLRFMREHYQTLARQAASEPWTPLQYLAHLVEGELQRRQDRALQRRLKAARFPLLKTLDAFLWDWPTKINRMHVQQLFQLHFLDHHTNVSFLGGVGLGKTHLAIALAYSAGLAGHGVLFTTAVDALNALIAAQAAGRLKPRSTAISSRACSVSMRSATYPSIKPVPICSCRSSAIAMSMAR